ncbi:MAG: hypothetical protein J0L93_00020 [Deltaproteobacteria bacterium]|nr:hypothetical protein [Deltaproteobacteria bacterium]
MLKTNLHLKKEKRLHSGQTILELCFFLMWFAGFFVLAYYLSTIFVVAQKQTMLVRHQAFMELGNYSDYSESKQGEDNPKEAKSQVIFKLGEKTKYVRVDLEKNSDFQKAVQGEIKIDVSRSLNQDRFWENYELPKAKTTVLWNKQGETQVELELMQVVAIAHNRSINLKDTGKKDQKSTGMFSGSMHFNDFVKLAGIELPTERGLRDNQDALKDALKTLVKNDSSLADEAAALEKSINAADSLSGSMEAALIAMAVQIAMQAGMDALKNAMSGIDMSGMSGSSDGGYGGGGGVSGASGGTDPYGQIGGMFDPGDMASATAGGDLGSGLMKTVLSPFENVAQGARDFTGGLARGGAEGLMTTASGAAKLMNTASMVGGFAGVDMHNVQLASSILSAPSALASGMSNFEAAMNNINTAGIGDVFGAAREISQPLTRLASFAGPGLGVPLGQIGTALGVASGINGSLDLGGVLASGAQTASETAQSIGALAGNLGSAYGGMASLTGADGTPASFLAMGGAVFGAAGSLGNTIENIKMSGIDLNPISIGEHIIQANIDGAKKTLEDFGTNMKDYQAQIETNIGSIMSPSVQIENAEAQKLMQNLANLDRDSSGAVAYQLHGIDSSTTKTALMNATDRMEAMSDKIAAISAVNSKDIYESERVMAQTKEQLAIVNDSVKNLRDASMGFADVDQGKLADANRAAEQLAAQWGETKRTSEYASAQSKSYETTSQRTFINDTLTYGTMKDAKVFESDMAKINPFYAASATKGSTRATDAYGDILVRQADMRRMNNYVAQAKSIEDRQARQMEFGNKISQLASGIPLSGPIMAANRDSARENAGSLAVQLNQIRTERAADLTSDQAARWKSAEDRLNSIASGQRDFVTPRETFYALRDNFNQREATIQQLEYSLKKTLYCKDKNC